MGRLILSLAFMINFQFSFSQQIIYAPKAVKVTAKSVKVNGTLNASFGGTSRVIIEAVLPPGTVEWYFSFKTRRDKNNEEAVSNTLGFTSKIASLLSSTYTGGTSVRFIGLTENAIKSILISKGAVPVNVYAFDPYNAQLFLNRNAQIRAINGSYNTSQSEGSSIITEYKSGSAFIGIDNVNFRTGIWVDVEVTATVLESKEIQSLQNGERNPKAGQKSFGAYTKQDLVGKWKDDNSTFELLANGNIYVQWQDGQSARGKWSLNEKILTYFLTGVESNFRRKVTFEVLYCSRNNLKYQLIYKATRGKIFNASKLVD